METGYPSHLFFNHPKKMLFSLLRVANSFVPKNSCLKFIKKSDHAAQRRPISKVIAPSSRKKRPADSAGVKTEIGEDAQEYGEKKDFDFDAEVMKVMRQVCDAAVPMIGPNPGFAVIFMPAEPKLTIFTGKGSLFLTVDKNQALLNLQSFLSGAQQYYYDTEEHAWLSISDKHNLRGVVTRDLIRHSRGCPDLDDKS